jgi:hypothetical protein
LIKQHFYYLELLIVYKLKVFIMYGIKKLFFYSTLIIVFQPFCFGLPLTGDALRKSRIPEPQKQSPGLGEITGAVVAVSTVIELICKGYNYCHPSEEQELRNREAAKEMEILKAKQALNASLAAHAQEEKNCNGIPCACEAAANNYAALAGFDALEQVLEEFRRATGYKQHVACRIKGLLLKIYNYKKGK